MTCTRSVPLATAQGTLVSGMLQADVARQARREYRADPPATLVSFTRVSRASVSCSRLSPKQHLRVLYKLCNWRRLPLLPFLLLCFRC